MSDYATDVVLNLQGNAVCGKIREHHPAHSHSRAQSNIRFLFGIKGRNIQKTGPSLGRGFQGEGRLATIGFAGARSDGRFLSPGPEIDFIEFRFPHSKKHDLKKQFAGQDSLAGSQFAFSKTVKLQNADALYVTCGKMNTYPGGKVLTGTEVASGARGGLDAGMTAGESIAGLVAATGGTVAMAGLTLGIGLGVAAVAIAATAANNHREHLRNKQVFLRISRSRVSTDLRAYFPYEEKIYWSQVTQNPDDVARGVSYRELWESLRRLGISAS